MIASLWVAELVVSDATAQKLAGKHQLDLRDVRDAIVCVRGLRYTGTIILSGVGAPWCRSLSADGGALRSCTRLASRAATSLRWVARTWNPKGHHDKYES